MTDSQELLALNEKVDALSAQIQILTDYVADQQQRQREWDELKDDLIPIANEMFAASVEELSEIEAYVQLEDILHLLKRLARNTHNFERMLDQLESLNDLMLDLGPIVNDAFLQAVNQLDEMERKGYFDVMREGVYVFDNIVEAFGPEDVRALGDNVVTILSTVREMTQPEIMHTAQNLARTFNVPEVRQEELDVSFLGLIKQMRDPEMRRGLALTLTLLKAIGSDSPTGANGSQASS